MNSSKKPFLSEEVAGLVKDRKYFYALGRRKESIATVRVYPNGKGVWFINNRPVASYLSTSVLQSIPQQPLKLLNLLDTVDVVVKVQGGGRRGQADSIRLGIARALLKIEPSYRMTLKKLGLLTRDPRVKERKKYGLKRARRAPQWSKR